MKYAACPLCGANSVFIDKIPTQGISELYKRKYRVNFEYLWEGEKYLNYLYCEKCGLKYFDPIITGDNAFYKALQEKDWYYLHDDKAEYTFSSQFINKNDKVLDVGSGRGVFKRYIDCQYYQGLDFSSKAIELAILDGVNVQAIPVENHCMTNMGFYDVVVLFQIVEHIREIDMFLHSSIKCLRRDGYLIIATPDNDGFIKNVSNFYLNLPPHHVLHWNEQSLSFLADKYGLDIEIIYREPLAPVHKIWWYTTIINLHINKMLRRKTHIVNLDFISWFLHAISNIIGRVVQTWGFHRKVNGQSIIVVYKKK
jgi:2-polyprenyl-3-methyl-5-hydroxy-6-metoxy-1,4-benzoquinol methylase